ncbi:unnamed protein product (apicoplast) [Plasmodium relictum]|uniref:DNA-directed RNA polymerase subunit beta n=1 Tax=Plasmodium relictum TaxID=85471 RepID=A0A1J1HGJ5_PLARL|nr:unnamed protein product [Plasmodium relictum]CRH02965.1 unnamed protein product [Plasmodium relictum]
MKKMNFNIVNYNYNYFKYFYLNKCFINIYKFKNNLLFNYFFYKNNNIFCKNINNNINSFNNNKMLYNVNNNFLYLYEIIKYNWYKYLILDTKYNLFVIYNNYIKYLYKYNIKLNLYLIKNLYNINNNLINNNIIFKNNYIIYNNQINIYSYDYINLLINNNFNNKIYYNYNNNIIYNLYLNDITIGLQSINIIFENKNIKNYNISFISKDVYIIFHIKYYNYLDNIIYIYNMCNKYKKNYFNYKLNFYSYIFEDISSIIYSGYSLNTDFYSINNNIEKYFNYLLKTINIYQSCKSSFIYIYNILLESIIKQYNYQNIYLPSIYFELIIKKMLSCIKIISHNFKIFKYNDIIPLYLINIINYSLILNNKYIYKYKPIILGITKSILANSGFLSNISFQNTFKIINLNILNNKIDWLIDIKSKIIMTDLLPIGNGWYRYFTQ